MASVQVSNMPYFQERDIDNWLNQHPQGACIDEVLDWMEGPDKLSTNNYAELKSWNLKETFDNLREDEAHRRYSQRGNCLSTLDDETWTIKEKPEDRYQSTGDQSKLPDISWFCEKYNEEVEISKIEENLIPHTVTEKMLSDEDTNSSSSSLIFSSSSSSDESCSPFIDVSISPTSKSMISTTDNITMQASTFSSSLSSHEEFTSSSSSSLTSVSSMPHISEPRTKVHSDFSFTDIVQQRINESCRKSAGVAKGKPRQKRTIRKPGSKRGRIPGQRSNTKHLCDFMKTLLSDPATNPSLVRWEDEPSRVFSIIQSKMVAQMWGTFKNNKKMNYENFGRAMRYCRKVGDFDQVPDRFKAKKKKLIFKFGPRATY